MHLDFTFPEKPYSRSDFEPGSSMYYERLAAAVEEASGLPVLGYLPESEEYHMESRHLGLFLPGEIDRLRERIGRLADQMEKSIAVDRVLEVAGMLPLRIETKRKKSRKRINGGGV